ncbi:hypothetical protein GPJ56_004800 [Histomonas meleagridis]|uniref:uncharacterized protein n=1 Tax=Histomonas meleagridis TaxID=135588 RepID=UPI00355A4023|nr:hypothetical protein GPJ56_004800 [Histomonas meleagridis]KAH0803451.1 hypothetical protein GO595_003795 [Histomonas meleagridis]
MLLQVIDHFTTHVTSAHSFFFRQKFLGFIYYQLSHTQSDLHISSLLTSLYKFIGSPCSEGYSKEDLYNITNYTLDKIYPNFFLKPTSIIVPIINILTAIIRRDPRGKHVECIEKSGVSSLLITVINHDNMELSFASLNFLAIASYYSDRICYQLSKMCVITELSNSLRDKQIFDTCSDRAIQIMYNTIVFCYKNDSNYSTIAFSSPDYKCFVDFLKNVFENAEDTSLKQHALLLLGLIVDHFPANDQLISFLNEINVFGLLQPNIETGSCDGAAGALSILYRLTIALNVTPLNMCKNIVEIVIQQEMIKALNCYCDTCDVSQSREIAECVMNWINKELELRVENECW